MTLAITREVSPAIARCELTHLPRVPIDLGRARAQHQTYVACLRDLGCEVMTLPAMADFPDSVFVEDAAIVLDELAIITRPGAASRRGELETIEAALSPHREVERIVGPATLDGGDVIVADRRVFVGMSSRSTREGAAQLRSILEPRGYAVREVPVARCLHLKSACTFIGDATMLVNPRRIEARFEGLRCLEVDPEEPDGANALRIGDRLLSAAAAPRTRDRLQAHGFEVMSVDISELAKAEGAITCSSLIVA